MTGPAFTNRPVHVLLTTDVVGGVWDFSWILADELIRLGNRVTLLAFGRPSRAQRRQAAAAGADLLDAPLKLEWMQGSADDLRAAQILATRLVDDIGVDVVHANQYALAQVDAGVPVVLTAHSDVLSWRKWNLRGGEDGPIPIEWTHYAALVHRGLQAATAVIAVSRFLAEQVRGSYKIARPVPVIHNGWPAVARPVRPAAERGRLTLLAGRAWDSAKNVALVAAAAQGWATGRVLLAGDQCHPESGHPIEFGPPIVPLSRVPRGTIDRILGEARVYVAPARYEPFGLLPVQAALAGCPLLLSDIPSFRELWDGAALFFRSDDVADLRRQWGRLLDDDELARELAGRARAVARERYSSARMAHDYLAVYTSVLAGQHRSVRTPARSVHA